MPNRDNRYPWWLIVGLPVALIAVGAIFGRTVLAPAPPPAEPKYLPSEVITVKYESPDTLAELAVKDDLNGVLTLENGVLRDRITGLEAEIVASLSVETEPALPPSTAPVRIIKEACEDGGIPNLTYWAELRAEQFRGLDRHGELAEGWAGEIRCGVYNGTERALLLRQSFTPLTTTARSADRPEPPRRPQRWLAGIQYSVLSSSTHIQNYDEYISTFRPDAIRVYAGYRLFPLKKRTLHVGGWADSSAAGVMVGMSW